MKPHLTPIISVKLWSCSMTILLCLLNPKIHEFTVREKHLKLSEKSKSKFVTPTWAERNEISMWNLTWNGNYKDASEARELIFQGNSSIMGPEVAVTSNIIGLSKKKLSGTLFLRKISPYAFVISRVEDSRKGSTFFKNSKRQWADGEGEKWKTN